MASEELRRVQNSQTTTYYYLAYGSNLSAETFLGVRGIHPISQTNVSVPMLELTFSLPGCPYIEPCMANVNFRKIPEKPKLPPFDPPTLPPIDPPPGGSPIWDGGLIGVVYELTEDDYRTVIRTEGGGTSYKDVIVPCIPLPPRISVPEKPPIPELPKPMLAHTLYHPYIPEDELPDDPKHRRWWRKMLLPTQRPDPNYAQASARYLKLIRDGAREHEFPDAYQSWLDSLPSYTITTRRQQIAQFFYSFIVLFFLGSMKNGGRKFFDKRGNAPSWLAVVLVVLINSMWLTYDYIVKPLFGDGERTEEQRDEREASGSSGSYTLIDDGKLHLLERDW